MKVVELAKKCHLFTALKVPSLIDQWVWKKSGTAEHHPSLCEGAVFLCNRFSSKVPDIRHLKALYPRGIAQ